jgi:sigma54-dependent transcription regulator
VSISDNLFESEFFGHVKGAFTDAKSNRDGRFKLANKGTLFLDEIGNLSMGMQAKLGTSVGKQTFDAGIGPWGFTMKTIDNAKVQIPNRGLTYLIKHSLSG